MADEMKVITDRMDRIISLLEALVIQNQRETEQYDEDEFTPPRLTPIIPTFPDVPLPDVEMQCPDCSVSFKGIMGYVCQKPGCPMGCGPVTC